MEPEWIKILLLGILAGNALLVVLMIAFALFMLWSRRGGQAPAARKPRRKEMKQAEIAQQERQQAGRVQP